MNTAIALTAGEPAGIGPDIVVQMAQQAQALPVIAYTDADMLRARAAQLGLPLQLRAVQRDNNGHLQIPAQNLPAQQLYIEHVPCAADVVPGRPDTANASHVLTLLQRAADDCLAAPQQLALVTGPVQKSLINAAGITFSGHTEFFAECAGVDKVVMMLATRRLRVALVTTHLPLRAVPDAITADNVRRTLQICHDAIGRFFTGRTPRLLVCGLNPHAGEDGHLGREEIDIIEPVMRTLRAQGMDLLGPLPADTSFTAERLQGVDAVVAMYHDQGLPVLKAQGFGEAINITLGLPFVRTSVDHGTALSLAGSGQASHTSLLAAIDCAAGMLRTAAAR